MFLKVRFNERAHDTMLSEESSGYKNIHTV